MKTILLIISIMVFGLYSCGDEVTNPTPTPEQETKKYTLEEILADSNWVEITDTLHYPEKFEFNFLYEKNNDFLIIKSESEFHNFLRLDTMFQNYDMNQHKNDIDFKNYFIVSNSTFKTAHKTNLRLFKNENIKSLFYNIELKHQNLLSGRHRFNWLQINNKYLYYNLLSDTTLTFER